MFRGNQKHWFGMNPIDIDDSSSSSSEIVVDAKKSSKVRFSVFSVGKVEIEKISKFFVTPNLNLIN